MQKFSIYDMHTSRQARNLWEMNLSEAVRPWFRDTDSERVRSAIEALSEPHARSEAAEYLGLQLVQVA
ncbi:MAG: hypothetical protein Q4D87_00105 [Actinomycetaceae bacterium]|nr:hypothetical protein [Actinomycetaceae bacterium]